MKLGKLDLVYSIIIITGAVGGGLYVKKLKAEQVNEKSSSVTSNLQSSDNSDFASLLKRLDKDKNKVTTIEEIVEGFGEIADRKGVYHNEYVFTLSDGTRQSLLIDLDYRER